MVDFNQINFIVKLRIYSRQNIEVTCVIVFGMLQKLTAKMGQHFIGTACIMIDDCSTMVKGKHFQSDFYIKILKIVLIFEIT